MVVEGFTTHRAHTLSRTNNARPYDLFVGNGVLDIPTYPMHRRYHNVP